MDHDRRRVLVQLTAAIGQASDYKITKLNGQQTSNESNCSQKNLKMCKSEKINAPQCVNILNNHTLMTNTIDRTLNFDFVGNAKDAKMRAEINKLMDHLVAYDQKCCLIRVRAVREFDSKLLRQLLVVEMKTKLVKFGKNVHSIHLEYYDLGKASHLDTSTKSDSSPEKQNISFRKQLNNIQELLRWFREDYALLWAEGKSHECLDIELVYTDRRRQLHKIRFSILQLYVNLMDCETKDSLHIYLGQLYIGHEKQNNVIECLRNYLYIGSESDLCTWLVFDVPIAMGETEVAVELLKLADAAFMAIKSMSEKAENKEIANGNNSLENYDKNCLTTAKIDDKDLHTLSFWYCKVDEKFSQVIAAMEAYYNEKFTRKIECVCRHIKDVMKNIEDVCHNKAEPVKKSANMKAYLTQYNFALEIFNSLSQETKKYPYWNMLKIYIKTKRYELKKHSLRCKLKQLHILQSRVSSVIGEEIEGIKF